MEAWLIDSIYKTESDNTQFVFVHSGTNALDAKKHPKVSGTFIYPNSVADNA